MKPLPLTIVPGRQHGRTIGFRTLNFDIAQSTPDVEHGIYAGWVQIDGVRHRAAIHYGPRPVLDDPKPTLEAHLLDIELITSPAEAVVELIHRLRDIQKFATTKALIQQISLDVERVRSLLGEPT